MEEAVDVLEGNLEQCVPKEDVQGMMEDFQSRTEEASSDVWTLVSAIRCWLEGEFDAEEARTILNQFS